MDLKRKIEIVTQAVSSIATHTDADSVVRLAALDEVLDDVNAAKRDILKESAKEIAALTATPEG
jgi:hypothetical protein